MQVYKCDACGQIIEDPYKMKMKEFYIRCTPTYLNYDFTKKVKIHLCNDCYHNLNNLAVAKLSKDKEIVK